MCGIIAVLGDRPVINLLLEGLRRMEYRGYDSAGLALIDTAAAITGAASASANGSNGQVAKLLVEKRVGKVKVLADACSKDNLTHQTLGIAHTRWATHGVPSDVNSHPHVSMDANLAIVHNGIIENYASLKKRLQAEGYVFKSQTDSEVFAHLIRFVQATDSNISLEDAVSLALSQVKGAYGVCVVDAKRPNMLIGARRGSPLILGIGDDSLILASDGTALVGTTKKVIYLEDNDLVICRRTSTIETSKSDDNIAPPGYEFEIRSLTQDAERVHSLHPDGYTSGSPRAGAYTDDSEHEGHGHHSSGNGKQDPGLAVITTEDDQNPSKRPKSSLGKRIKREISSHIPQVVYRKMNELELSLEKIEKGGYDHFMLKEIMEQPAVLRDCMRGRIDEETGVITLGGLREFMPRIAQARRIIICGCGTSWHSGLVGEYLIESLAKIPVEVEYASEFRYRNPIIYPDDVVIAISQSGETADTLEAVRLCKSKGALAIGLVNVVGSSIARATDCGCYLHVGPEVGVASTKAFTGQVTTLAMLALKLAKEKNLIEPDRVKQCGLALLEIPRLIEKTLSKENCDKIIDMSKSYRYAQNFLYLGRGFNFVC